MSDKKAEIVNRLKGAIEAVERDELSAIHVTTVSEEDGEYYSFEMGHPTILDAMATHHTRLRIRHGPIDEDMH